MPHLMKNITKEIQINLKCPNLLKQKVKKLSSIVIQIKKSKLYVDKEADDDNISNEKITLKTKEIPKQYLKTMQGSKLQELPKINEGS